MDPKADSSAGAAPLQFERAEFKDSPGQSPCAFCKQPLAGVYFDINGMVACAGCKAQVLAAFEGGSGLGRLIKAVGLGTLAAAAGGGLYYAVTAMTGYNIGLISIAVGWLVGTAVFTGSGRRGGWVYQLLAAVLAYLAIGASFVPEVLSAAAAEPAGAAAPADAGASPDESAPAEEPPRAFMAIAVALTGPVVVGFESPISGLIYAFALWEAGRRNKRTVISVNGPFQVSAAAPGTPAASAEAVQVAGHAQRD